MYKIIFDVHLRLLYSIINTSFPASDKCPLCRMASAAANLIATWLYKLCEAISCWHHLTLGDELVKCDGLDEFEMLVEFASIFMTEKENFKL